MAKVAEITSSPARASSSYYEYGRKTFETNAGAPPQVRWRPTRFEIVPSRGTLDGESSIGTAVQTLECTVWGNDEAQAWDEFTYLCMGLNAIRATSPANV